MNIVMKITAECVATCETISVLLHSATYGRWLSRDPDLHKPAQNPKIRPSDASNFLTYPKTQPN